MSKLFLRLNILLISARIIWSVLKPLPFLFDVLTQASLLYLIVVFTVRLWKFRKFAKQINTLPGPPMTRNPLNWLNHVFMSRNNKNAEPLASKFSVFSELLFLNTFFNRPQWNALWSWKSLRGQALFLSHLVSLHSLRGHLQGRSSRGIHFIVCQVLW